MDTTENIGALLRAIQGMGSRIELLHPGTLKDSAEQRKYLRVSLECMSECIQKTLEVLSTFEKT